MNYNIHMKKNNHGFTLIELIVTLAVVSIVLATGIPALNQMTSSNRLVSQINNIAASLALARSESIKRGQSITLCGSTDGSTCNTSSWETGWIIFSDSNNNATLDSATTDSMIKIVTQFSGGSTLRLSQSDNTGIIRYRSDGGLRDQGGGTIGTDRGTFTLCDNDPISTTTRARAININPIGRVSRAEGATVNEKPVHDITGVDITCP